MATIPPLYRDLCVESREIRLLMLRPSPSSSAPIEVSLDIVSLPVLPLADSRCPYYVALSYRWGEPSKLTVSTSGHTKTVTDNLSVALHALRDTTETKILWIDALCINQEDNLEKEHQIKLMGDIYQLCASCWIWLGEAIPNETEAAVMLLKDWASNENHLHSNVNFNSICITIATELTKREWFNRVWTVQEAILPKNLVIICGSRRIPWTIFADAANNLQKHLSSPCCISLNDTKNAFMKDVIDFLHAVMTIERSRKPLHTRKSRSNPDYWKSEILTCLHYYRNREATVPQDKIFGLRSLINQSGQDLIKLDCSASVEDVYTSLCIEHITQNKGSLEILKYVLWSAEPSKVETGLPSWVPDWRLQIPETRWQRRRMDRYSLYEANKNHHSGQPEFVLPVRCVLSDKGVRCGVVAKVGSERLAGWSNGDDAKSSNSQRDKKKKANKENKKEEKRG